MATLHGGVFDVPKAELAQLTEAQAGKFEWGRTFGAWLRSSEAEKARGQLGHDRIHHLGNGVDPARFAGGDRAGFRAAHGLPENAVVLACISRIDPQKDQPTLVEAFDRLAGGHPELHLMMAGPETAAAYVEKLNVRIAASPFSARIHKLGSLDPTGRQLADALAASDVFVLPSRHEPFGIVVLEAWCAGLPVVVSRVGGLQSLVTAGRTGAFFEAGEAEGLAGQLAELVADPGMRRAWGRRVARRRKPSIPGRKSRRAPRRSTNKRKSEWWNDAADERGHQIRGDIRVVCGAAPAAGHVVERESMVSAMSVGRPGFYDLDAHQQIHVDARFGGVVSRAYERL